MKASRDDSHWDALPPSANAGFQLNQYVGRIDEVHYVIISVLLKNYCHKRENRCRRTDMRNYWD